MGKLCSLNYREIERSYAGCRPIHSYDIDYSDRITQSYKYTHGSYCRSLNSEAVPFTNFELGESRISPSVIIGVRYVMEINVTHNRRITTELPCYNNNWWSREYNPNESGHRLFMNGFFS